MVKFCVSGTTEKLQLKVNDQYREFNDDSTIEKLDINDGDRLTLILEEPTESTQCFPPERMKTKPQSGPCNLASSTEDVSRQEIVFLDERLLRAAALFPECFSKIPMLYLRSQLNGTEILGLVDTGAQTSIISMKAVKKCGLDDAVDKRFSVVANGVGGSRSSLGRILASGDVRIQEITILCAFDVLETDVQDADLIFGLDVLSKNRAVLDIAGGTIRFGSLGSVSFIPQVEAENLKPFSEDLPSNNSLRILTLFCTCARIYSLQTAIVLLLLLAVLFICYLIDSKRYWIRQGVPGPKPRLFTGNTRDYAAGLHTLDERWIAMYGKTYGMYLMTSPELVSADIDILRVVLVKNFENFMDRTNLLNVDPSDKKSLLANSLVSLKGSHWSTVRSQVAPAFSTGKIKQMVPIFHECSKICTALIDDYEIDGRPVPIKE
ncbi:hypothetical protein Q1695_006466 [Nippostrongylus brasiliensis]|nr:hypothetical protein Q1695_006466 [Nippostrongylus brasiliensis]